MQKYGESKCKGCKPRLLDLLVETQIKEKDAKKKVSRRFVRKTFCQNQLRRFVMKTFCQDCFMRDLFQAVQFRRFVRTALWVIRCDY